ncbi:hypothetical protein DES49_2137 [Halospina denitrificans]|uniref:YD repeat-containing protein n=1 Tax=Halospina denitrificans TaxID=332522 RepID=A0A4R7JQB3_9GAMM|nr:hypothetical protein [Halospina denitrificans]TDT40371.1 hypothetical protein DES49_2137 [Halospina denitrificans]
MNRAYSGLASTIRNLLIAGSSALLLAGCLGGSSGGGGGDDDTITRTTFDGNENQATVSSNDDAAEVAYASTEGTYQAINSETTDVPTAAIIESAEVEDALTADLLRIIEENDQLSMTPTAATLVAEGSCGGEILYEGDDESGTTENGTLNFSYTYDNYCVSTNGGQIVTDGTGDYSATYVNSELTEYSMTWNLTYTVDDGQTVTSTLLGTTTCKGLNTATPTCSYSEDFEGPDGETYRVENVSINEDSNGNYDVSARVYDGDLGYVDFDASGIDRQNCANGNFTGGTITITDSSGAVVVEVSFPNCTECVVTFGGNAERYNQPDRT